MLDKKLFQATEVVSKEVDLPGGKITLHFRTLTSSETSIFHDAFLNRDFAQRANVLAWVIEQSLCNADGSQVDEKDQPVITVKQIKTLKPVPFQLILAAIFEVNQPEEGKP